METTIKHEIASCTGGDENASVTLFAYTDSGETQIVVRKTYLRRFNLQEYAKAMKLYEELNGAGKIVTLESIADVVTHRKSID